MSRPTEEERFSINVVDLTGLVHELVTICWDEGCQEINPILILGAKAYLAAYDKKELIEIFIKHSHMYWEEVRLRKENFFIEHANAIFKHLPVKQSNIGAFRMLFEAVDEDGEYIVNQDDRDAIWDMFDSLIKICVKYIHRIREVVYVETENGRRPGYKNAYFPEIPVRKLAREWDIDLPLPEA